MSTVPEIAQDLEEEKAREPQNEPQTISTTATPEITQKEATQESANPPTPLNNSTQPANAQNQQNVSSPSTPVTKEEEGAMIANPTTNQEKQSSVPEITSPELGAAPATSTNPPKLDDNSAQPIKSQNQETTLASVPPKPTTTIPPKLDHDSSAQTTEEKICSQKKSDQNEAPNETDSITSIPPEIETSKQDSTNAAGADQPAEGKDSTNNTSQADETETHSKKDSICLPLLGFLKSKEKKSQSKDKPVQDSATTASKDELSKSTDPQKPVAAQDSAITSGKDELSKPPHPQKPVAAQDSATTSGKDEISKSTDPQKPVAAQDSATTSGGGDEHSKSTAPQNPTVVQDSVDSKDELSKSIDADIKFIIDESNKLDKYKDRMISQAEEARQRFDVLKTSQGTEREFRELKKEVTKMKLQIPSKHKADADEKDSHKSQEASKSSRKNITEAVMKQLPQLYQSSLFKDSEQVKDFEAVFEGLSSMEVKLCLLCFAVFPENAIIKKRLMVYWWIAEGFVRPIPQDKKTAEEFADEYFQELTKMGFIEPVNKKCSLYVGCYKMHPFVRLSLIMMAEKYKLFNFDEEGNPTEKSSGTFQACLMGRGLLDYQDLQKGYVHVEDLEKLHAVFNVNEAILDFKPEWFSMMKNLNILYLGRWKVSPTDHIEVEESNFLDGLSTMDHLKFFSLQGVSRMMELPESILNLSSLMILDLRACHSLESIPEGIHHLKNLTYLDISECYLLEHMPKGLSMLSNLRVLKGFVVGGEKGKHCSLNNLAKLEKLVKLCIYTGLGEFPTNEDINALQSFSSLEKLTIAWGGGALQTKADNGEQRGMTPGDEQKKQPSTKQTFAKLEKLDLKSFPKSDTPSWLMPSNLKSLKKLYIRGGKFSDLGQYQYLDQKGTSEPARNKWEVEILRLKYLNYLEMDWRELQNLFPNLIYLEKVNCPKLSFFPSDGYGVWINKEKLKQMPVRS